VSYEKQIVIIDKIMQRVVDYFKVSQRGEEGGDEERKRETTKMGTS
jgi:hypothetical protein